jgi:hypothetical protein
MWKKENQWTNPTVSTLYELPVNDNRTSILTSRNNVLELFTTTYLYHFANEFQPPWSNKRAGKKIAHNNLKCLSKTNERKYQNLYHLNHLMNGHKCNAIEKKKKKKKKKIKKKKKKKKKKKEEEAEEEEEEETGKNKYKPVAPNRKKQFHQ